MWWPKTTLAPHPNGTYPNKHAPKAERPQHVFELEPYSFPVTQKNPPPPPFIGFSTPMVNISNCKFTRGKGMLIRSTYGPSEEYMIHDTCEMEYIMYPEHMHRYVSHAYVLYA